MIEVGTPVTPSELEEYFELRWRLLRAPWGQPRGTERDEHDETNPRPATSGTAAPRDDAARGRDAPAGAAATAGVIHATARDGAGRLIAVGRLHFVSRTEARIRYMATIESQRGRGVGRAVAEYLEAAGRAGGARRIVLNARDTAVGFYERLGYTAAGSAPTLFGAIAHIRMQKRLEP